MFLFFADVKLYFQLKTEFRGYRKARKQEQSIKTMISTNEKCSLSSSWHSNFDKPFHAATPWTQDVHWTFMGRIKGVQGVFWTSHVRSIYVLCPGVASFLPLLFLFLGGIERGLWHEVNIVFRCFSITFFYWDTIN